MDVCGDEEDDCIYLGEWVVEGDIVEVDLGVEYDCGFYVYDQFDYVGDGGYECVVEFLQGVVQYEQYVECLVVVVVDDEYLVCYVDDVV